MNSSADQRIGFICTREGLLAEAAGASRHTQYVTPLGQTGILYRNYGKVFLYHVEAEPVDRTNEWECRIWKIAKTGDSQIEDLALSVARAAEEPEIVRVNPNTGMLDALDRGLTGIAWSPEQSLLQGIRSLTLDGGIL